MIFLVGLAVARANENNEGLTNRDRRKKFCPEEFKAVADIGVWMRPEVLAHKLAARQSAKPLQAWNLGRWPSRLSQPGEHRLFVASNRAWRGYFTLMDEALYNPDDPRAPFALLFDTRTWRRIEPLRVEPFRGVTYRVPVLPEPNSYAEVPLRSEPASDIRRPPSR